MTLEQNIRAILECNFSIAREEIIDIAVNNIMNLSGMKAKAITTKTRCDNCVYQMKEYITDKRCKTGGYWVFSCKLNSDQFENHAVDGQPRQYCSSFEAKEKE